jgi:hypothetical protein
MSQPEPAESGGLYVITTAPMNNECDIARTIETDTHNNLQYRTPTGMQGVMHSDYWESAQRRPIAEVQELVGDGLLTTAAQSEFERYLREGGE